MPGPRQGHDPVDHATPRGSQQNQGEDHTDGLSPVRQRRIVQMVWTRPHVGKDQRPKVNHRQTVGIDRTTSHLRHEVVHHAQEASSQKEAYGIVPVPPLNHRILDT